PECSFTNRLKVFYRVYPARLQSPWGEAENGAVRVTIRSAALTLALLGICAAGAAQYQDQERETHRALPALSNQAGLAGSRRGDRHSLRSHQRLRDRPPRFPVTF